MTDKKVITTKFGDVPQELYDKIPSLKDHLEMLAANEKLKGLRADLQALNENIQKHSTEDDAEKIMAGNSLEEIKVTDKQELRRKSEALERAIELQLFEIQKLEARLIREGLKELEPLAKKYVKASIDALTASEKALTKQTELFVTLSMKGYKQNQRPAAWQTTPLESQLLSGGGFPSLALYLQERRQLWGLKPVGPQIKK
jgi:adenine-specific DNA methylase